LQLVEVPRREPICIYWRPTSIFTGSPTPNQMEPIVYF
jgi:hypothetical protein